MLNIKGHFKERPVFSSISDSQYIQIWHNMLSYNNNNITAKQK